MSKLLYLVAPYSHDYPRVREKRFQLINEAAAHLMRWGFYVFSPISHCHPIALAGGLPTGFDYWRGYDEAMIGACGALVVLQLAGWEMSVGVKAEIGIAERMKLPVVFAKPSLDGLRSAEPTIRRVLEQFPR